MMEVIEEQHDFIRDAMEEVVEDIALARSIEEGRKTKSVSRAEVFRLLAR
ncbi:MAG: hypothetical protein ACR2H1_00595 [Limisphaerales bacterium]